MISPRPVVSTALLLCVQAPGLGAEVEEPEVGRVVDPERRVAQPVTGVHDLRPVLARDLALVRSRSPEIRAWEAMNRWESSISDISRENSATGLRA